ncbi:hypothetical protein [Xenorhabdus hominickii]|uniref:hypothetical protein n=1 Tax=Xenorhabdus hominickii TaxID=351679 RepID=UPI003B847B91
MVLLTYNYSRYTHKHSYYDWVSEMKWKNISLMAGPVYRLNDYISVYGLIGATKNKLDRYYNTKKYVTLNDASLSYGRITI